MRPLPRPNQLAWQVFRGADATDAGLLSARQLASGNWRHIGYNLYADSRLEPDHHLLCHALALDLPERAFFAGPSAAVLHGVDHAASFTDPVHLLVRAGQRLGKRSLTIAHRMVLADSECTKVGGLPVTTPLRSCWDTALWLDLPGAVAIIDALLATQKVSREELIELALSRAGWHGSRRALGAFAMCDPGAQSPQESRLRVRLFLAGFPPARQQVPVQVKAITLHPDLAWPEFKVAVEYDGQWHNTPGQFHRDRARLNLLVTTGWIVIHVTSQRMRNDFGGIVREVGEALRLGGWRGQRRPRRTITQSMIAELARQSTGLG